MPATPPDLTNSDDGSGRAVPAPDLERVLDVDECLRFLAVSTVLVHLNNRMGSGHGCYLYEQSCRFSLIPCDLSMSFGGFGAGLSRDHLIEGSVFASRPAFRLQPGPIGLHVLPVALRPTHLNGLLCRRPAAVLDRNRILDLPAALQSAAKDAP
jgi:hypothetical protein